MADFRTITAAIKALNDDWDGQNNVTIGLATGKDNIELPNLRNTDAVVYQDLMDYINSGGTFLVKLTDNQELMDLDGAGYNPNSPEWFRVQDILGGIKVGDTFQVSFKRYADGTVGWRAKGTTELGVYQDVEYRFNKDNGEISMTRYDVNGNKVPYTDTGGLLARFNSQDYANYSKMTMGSARIDDGVFIRQFDYMKGKDQSADAGRLGVWGATFRLNDQGDIFMGGWGKIGHIETPDDIVIGEENRPNLTISAADGLSTGDLLAIKTSGENTSTRDQGLQVPVDKMEQVLAALVRKAGQ